MLKTDKTSKKTLSFEDKIFKNSILYVIIFKIISLIGDYFVVGFGLLQQIYSVNLVFLVILYLLTKKTSIHKLLIPFTIIIFSTLSAIWFLNGGLSGVSPYLFLAFGILLMLVSPQNSKIIYFLILMILFFFLTIINLYFPEYIVYLTPPEQRILELAVSIFIILNALFLMVNKFLISLDESKSNELEYFEKLKQNNFELNQLNHELQENNQTLRNLNKVQSQLQTIIVHDIKRPVGAVINGLNLLTKDIKPNLNKDDLRFLEV